MKTSFKEFDLKAFGLKLAKLREEKKISAHALSLLVGKNKNYMSMVESGNINISIKSFIEICQALEIEPAILFTR